MVSFAHSPILKMNYLLNSLKNSNQIWIFICFISRRYGAHTEKMIMNVMFVYMLIIGKITGESHLYLTIQKICAKIGTLKDSLPHTRMVVKMSIDANSVMDGKNKSSTLIISKLNSVCTVIHVKNLTVLTTIVIPTENIH
jgi:hypothetical protein